MLYKCPLGYIIATVSICLHFGVTFPFKVVLSLGPAPLRTNLAPIGLSEGQLLQQGSTCSSAHFKIKMAASVCRCYEVRHSFMSFITALRSPAEYL